MKITEIVAGMDLFKATIKAKHGKSSTAAKTIVFADGISQARALLAAMYGEENVISVTRIAESQISEAVPNGRKPKFVPNVLPTKYKHDVVQHTLLNHKKRNALHVKPTIDDLRAARSDFEAEQKRVNREYEGALNDRVKWVSIRKRRLRNV